MGGYCQFLLSLFLLLCTSANPFEFSWYPAFPEICSLHVLRSGRRSSDISLSTPLQIDDLTHKLSQLESEAVVKYRITRRSDPCLIYLIVSPDDVQGSIGVLKYLQSSDFLIENPAYVIFRVLKVQMQFVPKFLATLRFIHTTSKYIVVTEESKMLTIVCLHCRYENTLRIQLNTEDTRLRHKIDTIWRVMHSTLNGSLVQVMQPFLLHSSLQDKSVRCNSLRDFRGDPRLCIVNLLAERLDFRIFFNPDRETKLAGKLFEKLMEDDGALDGVVSNEIDNWQVTQ